MTLLSTDTPAYDNKYGTLAPMSVKVHTLDYLRVLLKFQIEIGKGSKLLTKRGDDVTPRLSAFCGQIALTIRYTR